MRFLSVLLVLMFISNDALSFISSECGKDDWQLICEKVAEQIPAPVLFKETIGVLLSTQQLAIDLEELWVAILIDKGFHVVRMDSIQTLLQREGHTLNDIAGLQGLVGFGQRYGIDRFLTGSAQSVVVDSLFSFWRLNVKLVNVGLGQVVLKKEGLCPPSVAALLAAYSEARIDEFDPKEGEEGFTKKMDEIRSKTQTLETHYGVKVEGIETSLQRLKSRIEKKGEDTRYGTLLGAGLGLLSGAGVIYAIRAQAGPGGPAPGADFALMMVAPMLCGPLTAIGAAAGHFLHDRILSKQYVDNLNKIIRQYNYELYSFLKNEVE